MLSLMLATAIGSTPGGIGTSMKSGKGTRRESLSAPPQSPPTGPSPYIERGGALEQLSVSPARQLGHVPQQIWKGTAKRSPTDIPVTCSPTSLTSAMNSWPRGKGPTNGATPLMIAASRAQVATAIGRTRTSVWLCRRGARTSRHCTTPRSMKFSSRIGFSILGGALPADGFARVSLCPLQSSRERVIELLGGDEALADDCRGVL